jgi:hypothetical protein
VGLIWILSAPGERVEWDEEAVGAEWAGTEGAICEAVRLFDSHRRNGGAWVQRSAGKPACCVERFDPSAEELVGVPPVEGG